MAFGENLLASPILHDWSAGRNLQWKRMAGLSEKSGSNRRRSRWTMKACNLRRAGQWIAAKPLPRRALRKRNRSETGVIALWPLGRRKPVSATLQGGRLWRRSPAAWAVSCVHAAACAERAFCTTDTPKDSSRRADRRASAGSFPASGGAFGSRIFYSACQFFPGGRRWNSGRPNSPFCHFPKQPLFSAPAATAEALLKKPTFPT